jgi:hypothetical protein
VQDGDPQNTPPDFQRLIQDTLDSLPPDLRERISNIEVVVEDEPPPEQRLLGLYKGVPLTRRGSNYSGALPDKITIYSRPLERFYGHDPELLRPSAHRDQPLLTHAYVFAFDGFTGDIEQPATRLSPEQLRRNARNVYRLQVRLCRTSRCGVSSIGSCS